MAVIATLVQIALVGLVAWIVGRELVTGEIMVNWRPMRRSRNPIGYWIGIGIGFALFYVAPFVREMWR